MPYTRSTTSESWRRERKAAGGRKSRMPKRWGEAELERLRGELAGLSVAAQAEAMGTSKSSVDRMRRHLRDLETRPN